MSTFLNGDAFRDFETISETIGYTTNVILTKATSKKNLQRTMEMLIKIECDEESILSLR